MGRLLSLLKGVECSIRSRLGSWMQEVSLAGDQAASDVSTLQTEMNAAEADISTLQALFPNNVLGAENGGTGRAAFIAISPVRIQFVGDSNMAGSNGTETGLVGGLRHVAYLSLRQWRSDFDFIGSQVDSSEATTTFPLWFHEGHPGLRIDQIAAGYAGYVVAPTGVPDLIVDILGTNDIAQGHTAAQMMVDRAALDAAYLAANPNVKIIAMAPPPFVAGTTVAGNLAAWNAVRATYIALLQAYCLARSSYMRYSAITSGLAGESFQNDGVHINIGGEAVVGQEVAAMLNAEVLPPVSGATLPRAFRQRKPWASQQMTAAASQLKTTAHPGFNPGSGSLAVAVDYYPTLLDAGGLHTVGQFGAYGVSNFWAIYQQDRALRIYYNNPAGTIFGGVSEACLLINTWHRIVMIAHADSGTVGLYLNGRLLDLKTGQAAWAMTLQDTQFNNGATFSGTTGFYSRIDAFKGALVPRPGSMAAILAVESDYYDGQSLVEGAGSATFNLNASLADEISGGPILVASGGAATSPAYPSGTPARPWEYVGG